MQKSVYSSNEITNFLKKNGYYVSSSSSTKVRGFRSTSRGICTSKHPRFGNVFVVTFNYKTEEETVERMEKAKEMLRAEGYKVLDKILYSNTVLILGWEATKK